MAKSLGIHLTGRIVTGVVEMRSLARSLFHFPEDRDDTDALLDTPLAGFSNWCVSRPCAPVGSADPSMPSVWLCLESSEDGVVEDSPNLAQIERHSHGGKNAICAAGGSGNRCAVSRY